jgi:hypothetical protein
MMVSSVYRRHNLAYYRCHKTYDVAAEEEKGEENEGRDEANGEPPRTLMEGRVHWVLLRHVNNNSLDPWLNDRTHQDLARWLSCIKEMCDACDLLEGHYAQAAIFFIDWEDLVRVIRNKQQQYLTRTGHAYWIWDDFKEELREAIVQLESRAYQDIYG